MNFSILKFLLLSFVFLHTTNGSGSRCDISSPDNEVCEGKINPVPLEPNAVSIPTPKSLWLQHGDACSIDSIPTDFDSSDWDTLEKASKSQSICNPKAKLECSIPENQCECQKVKYISILKSSSNSKSTINVTGAYYWRWDNSTSLCKAARYSLCDKTTQLCGPGLECQVGSNLFQTFFPRSSKTCQCQGIVVDWTWNWKCFFNPQIADKNILLRTLFDLPTLAPIILPIQIGILISLHFIANFFGLNLISPE